ncbi:hypothetical protein SMB554_07055 [Sinorhizobium meliloti]|nr:hypothetical protein SMB554_07055 [Sinorhizobium meliloti]
MVITFQTQEPCGATVAKLEADTVPFISLGEASQAVVMRLQVKLPRIKVRTAQGEEPSRPR